MNPKFVESNKIYLFLFVFSVGVSLILSTVFFESAYAQEVKIKQENVEMKGIGKKDPHGTTEKTEMYNHKAFISGKVLVTGIILIENEKVEGLHPCSIFTIMPNGLFVQMIFYVEIIPSNNDRFDKICYGYNPSNSQKITSIMLKDNGEIIWKVDNIQKDKKIY